MKLPYFGDEEGEDRDDGGVGVPQGREAQLVEAPPEVVGVAPQLLYSTGAWQKKRCTYWNILNIFFLFSIYYIIILLYTLLCSIYYSLYYIFIQILLFKYWNIILYSTGAWDKQRRTYWDIWNIFFLFSSYILLFSIYYYSLYIILYTIYLFKYWIIILYSTGAWEKQTSTYWDIWIFFRGFIFKKNLFEKLQHQKQGQ